MVPIAMPQYTSFKTLANGSTGYYWTCPTLYRKAGCPYRSAALGVNLSQKELYEAPGVWNARLEDGRRERSSARVEPDVSRYGTVEWLMNAYLKHSSFLERVADFSRPDYKRVLDRVCDVVLKADMTGNSVRVGDAKVGQIGDSMACCRNGHFVFPKRHAREAGISMAMTMPHFLPMMAFETNS
ncbi:hypothetical protein HFO99_20605 [Rhizobium leguminosarum]|uniref:hypothetical protein n=1 Tax=Rhizobium leguminosarum TaxID=384 RepID=UPI001C95CAA2|nr:hypothetical protein [Rhizobium leguminosarum]MBY5336305.1 hypothetical protein [Rhizobium leguminosarum]